MFFQIKIFTYRPKIKDYVLKFLFEEAKLYIYIKGIINSRKTTNNRENIKTPSLNLKQIVKRSELLKTYTLASYTTLRYKTHTLLVNKRFKY